MSRSGASSVVGKSYTMYCPSGEKLILTGRRQSSVLSTRTDPSVVETNTIWVVRSFLVKVASTSFLSGDQSLGWML